MEVQLLLLGYSSAMGGATEFPYRFIEEDLNGYAFLPKREGAGNQFGLGRAM